MENLFFWNKWQKSHRLLYGFFLLLFISSCLLFIYSEFYGKNIGLNWEITQEVKTTSSLLDTFEKGFFQFSVTADNQYITQSYEGSLHNFPAWCCYLVTISILGLLISGSVTASYTKGIWYFVAITILGLFFYLLNLDVLEVFGLKKMYWAVGWFLAFGIATHIFHAFKPLTPILFRYLIFSGLAVIFYFLTIKFSIQHNPEMHFVTYGWMAPFCISLLYVIIISTDMLAGFLYVVTDSKNAKKFSSLLNFMLISLFFLGNVILTFLKNRGSIDWNIFYIEAPILLLIASILGIWSFKKKEPVYSIAADFSPATAIWYLVMAINCLLCYSFVNFTANDPFQEVLEDSVIFTHLTMGIMFILFVVANFMSMMEQNLAAHMVLYKPRYMPFSFVRIIGLVLILSIVLYNSNYQFRQALAGDHIQKAEVFIDEDNFLLAEEYLNSALSYDGGNHKANYLLAMLLRQKNKEDIIAKGLLKQALFKNPSPQGYASLGIYFLQEKDIIRSMETLREGKSRFPYSGEILNNLALAFAQTDIRDSTFFYLKAARKANSEDGVAASNQLAFVIENNINSAIENQETNKDLANSANLLAILNKSGKIYPHPIDSSFLKDTSLNLKQAAYAFNLAMNNLKKKEFFPLRWFDTLIKKPGNNYFYENLMYAKACRQYYSGNTADGIITLDQLQSTAKGAIRYNNVLSNWLMQQDAPKVAMDFLLKAKDAGDINADFGIAIATSFYMPGKEALEYWRNPVFNNDSSFKKLAIALHDIKPNVFIAGILPQLIINPNILYQSFQSFTTDVNKNKATGRLMQFFSDKGDLDLSFQLYENNPKTSESNWQYLRALKKANQKEKLETELNTDLSKGKTLYLKAWVNEKSNPEKAIELYRLALKICPLYDEGVTDAILFLKEKQSADESYEMLLSSVMLNQYSIAIQKAYTLQCIESNYFNFADYSLIKLKNLMNNTEYTSFAKEVELRKEKKLREIEWK